jgi:hypothetical protein
MHALRPARAFAALTLLAVSCSTPADPSGSGGTGGGGSAGGPPAKPLPTLDCDYQTAIKKSCAIAGCHHAKYKIGGLDMTLDDGLRARLLNVPATFADIDCAPDGQPFMGCVPATCPVGAKLIDTGNVEASVMISKMEGTLNMCGDQMPMPPGNSPTMGWSVDTKNCIEKFVRALAAGQ